MDYKAATLSKYILENIVNSFIMSYLPPLTHLSSINKILMLLKCIILDFPPEFAI